MAGLGSEFQNLWNELNERRRADWDLDVSEQLRDAGRGSSPRWLYFGPRPFVVREAEATSLPWVTYPDGVARRTLIFERQHTLWFARGGALALDGRVAVIIRGDIRAEIATIFSLRDAERLHLPLDPGAEPERIPSGEAIVVIESELVQVLYPEWFGAVGGEISINGALGAGNSRSLQACLDTACRHRVRAGQSLPPIPVVATGSFALRETLEARPDANGRGALWIEGNGDATTRGAEAPSLNRLPLGAPLSVRGQRPTWRPIVEDDRSALLRVHPRVSIEISGVGLRCFDAVDGTFAAPMYDVAYTLLLEEGTDDPGSTSMDPANARYAMLNRCGLTGGRIATVAVRPTVTPLGPWQGKSRARGRRNAINRSTRTLLRQCSLDGLIANARLDGGRVVRSPLSSLRVIELDGPSTRPQTSALAVIGGLIHQTVREPIRDPDRPRLEAGILMRGGSAYVRAVSFHLGEGPRPSKPEPLPGVPESPDGQDIWLDAVNGSRAPHLTVLHIDSQSWWFLGGTATRSHRPGSVCLLNVGAGDVNQTAQLSDLRGRQDAASIEAIALDSADPFQSRSLRVPPSIAWPGGHTTLLLEGCTFRRYVTIAEASSIVNVGSSFFLSQTAPPSNWLPRSATPRWEDPGRGHLAGRTLAEQVRGRTREPASLPVLSAVPGVAVPAPRWFQLERGRR